MLSDLFRDLRPKLTRWDGISLSIFAVLAWVGSKGFQALSGSFRQLLILIAALFGLVIILCFLEPALKRRWTKFR